jgi:hypothetical protein
VPSVDSHGDIETISQTDPISMGDTVKLVFRTTGDSTPPFTIRIWGPSGKVVMERVLRELPTGAPQSAPPLTFVASSGGSYRLDIWQLQGKSRGEATIVVR